MTPAVEIETDRLRLRPFTPADLDALASLLADPEVMRYLGREAGRTLSRPETEKLLTVFTVEWGRHGFGRLAAVDKGTGRLIGFCGWKLLEGTARTPELLYVLGKAYWGRGLAAEAAGACLRYGFEELGMRQVVALTRPEHGASRRVLRKLGLRYERDARYYGVDVARYAVTRAEFRADAAAPYAVRR